MSQLPSMTDPADGAPPSRFAGLRQLRRFFWQGRLAPAFWSIASALSLTINLVLIVILIILGRQLFFLKTVVDAQLLGGLEDNFRKMDAAHITTNITVSDTITVNDTIPVVFTLPLEQDTEVMLTQDTAISNASILFNGVWVPLNIVLPAGTPLNINLNIDVPVNTTIPVQLLVPVNLHVPVDIPLDQTQLHEPFVGLQTVVRPYRELLAELPNTWDETPFCGPLTRWLCEMILEIE